MSETGKQIMMQMISDHARCSAFYDAFDRELRRRPEVENSERAAMLIQVHLKVASAASMNLDEVKDPNQFAYNEVRHQGRLLTDESRAAEDISDFMQTNLDFCMDLMNELKEQLGK